MRQSGITVITPDPAQWDAFVDQHPEGHLLQNSRWAAVKQTTGWEVLRIGVCDDGELLAGAQVLIKRRYGLSAWYVPRGPLCADDHVCNLALVAAIRAQAAKQRAVFVRYEPNMLVGAPRERMVTRLFDQPGFLRTESRQPQHSVHVDLERSREDVLLGMTKGHRADIKKAAKQGVAVRVGTTDADVDVFVALMAETGARAGFGVHSKAYYAEVWHQYRQKQRAVLLIATHDDAPVAAAMVVASPQAACYLYGGSNAAAFACGANHAIQWEALQWAQAQGCAVYDLWGIPFRTDIPGSDNPEQSEMAGLIRFKKGFGGSAVTYHAAALDILMPRVYRYAASRFSL